MSKPIEYGIIRQAMAYRVKYRVSGARRVHVSMMGVHHRNRGGMYPQPDTVTQLGLQLLTDGFNVDEANYNGICVQEIPPQWRKHDPVDPSKPYETLAEYNMKMSSTPQLRGCFKLEDDICYGTLSHSHLLLVLKSVDCGAKWDLPEKFKHLADNRGHLKMSAVAEMDPNMASSIKEGLNMEILSWQLHMEEPSACSLISQALNRGHQIALQTSELTAVAVLSGAVGLSLGAAVAGSVKFETIRAKVRDELDIYVDEPDFIELFDFVVSLGANKADHINFFLAYGSMFVNSKKRQLRLQAFAVVNKLPLNTPRCKLAVLMRAFRKTPDHAFCPTPEHSWHRISPHGLMKMEDIIQYFHTTAVAVMTDVAEKLPFLANVYCVAAETTCVAHKKSKTVECLVSNLESQLLSALCCYHDTLVAKYKQKELQLPQTTGTNAWICFTPQLADKSDQAAKSSKTAVAEKLLPKVIQFNEQGKPMTSQDVLAVAGETEQEEIVVPVAEWMHSFAQAVDQEASEMAAIHLALRSISLNNTAVSGERAAVADVVQVMLSRGKRQLRVKVQRDLEENTLQIFPNNPNTNRLYKESTHPSRACVHVCQKSPNSDDPPSTYYIHPDFKMPEVAEVAAEEVIAALSENAAVAEEEVIAALPENATVAGEKGIATLPGDAAVVEETTAVAEADATNNAQTSAVAAEKAAKAAQTTVRPSFKWTWQGDESLFPFWAVPRMSMPELKIAALKSTHPQLRFNLEYVQKEVMVVVVGNAAGASMPITYGVTVPVLTNAVAVKKGDDLLLEIIVTKKN